MTRVEVGLLVIVLYRIIVVSVVVGGGDVLIVVVILYRNYTMVRDRGLLKWSNSTVQLHKRT